MAYFEILDYLMLGVLLTGAKYRQLYIPKIKI